MTEREPDNTEPIRFVDLHREYALYGPEWEESMCRVMQTGRYIGGEEVTRFEESFAKRVGCRFGVGTSSGSDALRLGLLAMGIKPGDEVATVSFTFTATVDAIVHVGAVPVFIDVDAKSFNMDPSKLDQLLGPKVKAILPVHLYGQPAEMDRISEIANRRGIPILEDAAQAHGARYGSRPCGSIGSAACFSFYPSKNLGALGDAGMITTNDEVIAQNLRLLREYGQVAKYVHQIIGFNSRLDAIQAAVLSAKLPHLDARNEARRKIAARYAELFEGETRIELPTESDRAHHVYHLYVVRTRARDRLRDALTRQGIETGLHYPCPVHLQASYRGVPFRAGDLRESERAAREVLSLPMFPELTPDETTRVAGAVRESVE
jgi:dTDP-4-amino-4,6-dideoxygalactose transaminase